MNWQKFVRIWIIFGVFCSVKNVHRTTWKDRKKYILYSLRSVDIWLNEYYLKLKAIQTAAGWILNESSVRRCRKLNQQNWSTRCCWWYTFAAAAKFQQHRFSCRITIVYGNVILLGDELDPNLHDVHQSQRSGCRYPKGNGQHGRESQQRGHDIPK